MSEKDILVQTDDATMNNLEDCARLLFPQEGETTPRLRFKGFEGKWVEAKLGELFTERVESNVDGEMLSVTMNNGVIKASENGRFDNSNSDKSHYKVVKVNDIAYNSMRMWQGASGCSAYEGIVSPAYTVVTPVEGVDPNFFAFLFKTPPVIKQFRLHSQGLTSDTWNLKYPAFSKISIFYPKDIEEQKKIASFMRGLDEQIVVKQQQLERLKQMKQACLGLLFADNQTLTPPLRFKGFSGEWIMMNFGELFVFLRNNSLSRAELDEKGSVKNVHYGDVLIKYGEIIDMRTDELPYIRNEKIAKSLAKDCILQNGDVVFADAAEDNAVGKCSEIVSMNGDKVVSGLHTIPCRPTRTFSEGFLGYCLNSNKFHDQLLPMIQGTKISSISKKALACTNIAFPENLKEQRRIASFFRNLDKQISSRKQQVEQLQQLKKACLNQMVA